MSADPAPARWRRKVLVTLGLPAALAGGLCLLAPGPRLRRPLLALVPAGPWALVWGGLAALSVVNSTS